MQRVLIIGSPGAGKSTLARALSHKLNLPVLHLDQHFWRPGWEEPSQRAWLPRVEALAAQEAWIMDGNFSSSFHLRFPRADTIIHLDYPTRTTLYRAIKRSLLGRGQIRPDSAPGCPERIDLEFYTFVWRFRRQSRARIFEAIEAWGGGKQIFTFKRAAELRVFLNSLTQPSRGGGATKAQSTAPSV